MSLNNAHEGYDYQDLITSYFILKEVLEGNLDSIFSIDKKHTAGDIPDRFDDLVITNGIDIQRKQIKYSNETVSKILLKDYLSCDSYYKIAIHKLFETWRALKTSSSEFRLCLAWDDPIDDDIKRVLELQPNKSSFNDFATKVYKIKLDQLWEENPQRFNRWDSLRNYVETNNIDRSEFDDFCTELVIEVCLPKASLKFSSPSDLEKILIEQAHRLGIEQYPNHDIYIVDFLIRLAKLAGVYRTKSIEISAREILRELRIRTDFGNIKQQFEIDQSKNIIADANNKAFLELAVKNRKTLLIGEPGAGKSWFLTNFIEYIKSCNIAVIRHYCFIDTEDEFSEKRINADVFFGNLIGDIERYFPTLKKEKKQKYAANLQELNLLLAAIELPLVIVVDGLDHIDRVLNTSATLAKDKTRIIEYISQIVLVDNVSIILGSQPVVEVEVLATNSGFIKENLPKWDIASTKELMRRFKCEDIQVNECDLSVQLYNKSEGNPLYLTYILKTLSKHSSISTTLIASLPEYDFNLKNYYEYLTNQITQNMSVVILSCLEFAVSKKELQEITPFNFYFDKDMKTLAPVISENTSKGGIKLYHDSFRRFNIEKFEIKGDLNEIYKLIINWLKGLGFYESDKSYRYLLNYLILTEQYDNASKFSNNSFLANSLYYGHSESLIRNNYRNFLHVAKKSQNWSLFIYLSELHRAISTTNSEEQHSQFLDNFELYFEAICTIYGPEKANNLLFFNGKKNYSDSITAKAFMILQKYDYSPQWAEIKALFENNIALEDFKYFMCYQIDKGKDLTPYFNKALSIQNTGYLSVFISEVFRQKGFDAIASLYQNIGNDENEIMARKINSALEATNCNQRIPVTNSDSTLELKPLDLSFTDDYFDKSELNYFYFNVEQHARADIETLIEFEKGIISYNFFYNWVKYFIRLYLIEAKFAGKEIENEVVENIKFLASDVDYYKGTPRAIDFTYNNSSLIDLTIERSLKHIKSKEAWLDVIDALIAIPHSALHIIENNFLNEDNINFVIDAYENFDLSDNENYSEHADYKFKKAIYYGKIGDSEKAKEELKKALALITSYTFHKDRSLEEVIEPLSSINNINQQFAKQYVKKLKYLTDAVMKHTDDGKGTRWLTGEWFEQLLRIDYYLAATYLVNEILTNEGFWKLDYMFVDFIQYSHDIEPIISNFLYKLSPTNTKDKYLSGFLDVIEKLQATDKKQAKLSLINLSIRDWNNSNDNLSNITSTKFNKLKEQFDIATPTESVKSKGERIIGRYQKKDLRENLTKKLCRQSSLRDKTKAELIERYEKTDRLTEEELNYLYFYLLENNNDKLATDLLIPIITKRFPSGGGEHYKTACTLIERLPLSNDTKIELFISNFVYSMDGWLSCFVNKESLKNAVKIDKIVALKILAKALQRSFANAGYLSKSTANLIIAFEYAGLDEKTILPMYERGFDFLQNRLPNNSDFRWEDIECDELSNMNKNELAIVVMLSKTKNLDAFIQKEVIVAIAYLMKYDDTLLIKPFKWFFHRISSFHQLTVASILELFLIEINNHHSFFNNIKVELQATLAVENLYIHNALQDILDGLLNE